MIDSAIYLIIDLWFYLPRSILALHAPKPFFSNFDLKLIIYRNLFLDGLNITKEDIILNNDVK